MRKIQIMPTLITGSEVHQYMVPEYNIKEEISPSYLSYCYQHYQQNLPDQL